MKEDKDILLLAAAVAAGLQVQKANIILPDNPADSDVVDFDLYKMWIGFTTGNYKFLLACYETNGTNSDGTPNDFKDPSGGVGAAGAAGVVGGLKKLLDGQGLPASAVGLIQQLLPVLQPLAGTPTTPAPAAPPVVTPTVMPGPNTPVSSLIPH
jgi:hypothetical protein